MIRNHPRALGAALHRNVSITALTAALIGAPAMAMEAEPASVCEGDEPYADCRAAEAVAQHEEPAFRLSIASMMDAADIPFAGSAGSVAPIATATRSLALGWNAEADNHSTALGTGARALSTYSVAVGTQTEADNYATAVGAGASAQGHRTVAIGLNSRAANNSAVAIGASPVHSGGHTAVAGADGLYSIAIGLGSHAQASRSIALGSGSVARSADVVSVGNDTAEPGRSVIRRRIVNVADGIDDQDAVTLRQLSAALSGLGGGGLGDIPLGHHQGIYTQAPVVTGSDAIAFGSDTRSTGMSTVAIGRQADASGRAAIALGVVATASGQDSSALGILAEASAENATALGSYSTASGDASTALGNAALSEGRFSVAVGGWAAEDHSLSFGRSYARAREAIAIGTFASADAQGAIALGQESEATARNAVALGHGARATVENTISVGRAGHITRRIVNVADGEISASSGDAVTGRQLFAAQDTINGLSGRVTVAEDGLAELDGRLTSASNDFDARILSNADAIGELDGRMSANETGLSDLEGRLASGETGLVRHDAGAGTVAVAASVGGSRVSMAGADGARVVTGLARGEISETSDEAVTGGQLFAAHGSIDALNDRVVIAEDDLADLDGRFNSVSADFDARIIGNADAIGELDGRVRANETGLSDLEGRLASGETGLVRHDADTGIVAVAASVGGSRVSVAGADGARVLSGVAEGAISETSDEAVTGGQLFAAGAAHTASLNAAGQTFASSLGAGAGFDPATGAFTAPSFTVMGSAYGDVGGAIGALNTQVGRNTTDIADLQSDGGGSGQAEVEALRAELEAMRAVMNAQSQALDTAMAQLDQLSAGNAIGGEAGGDSNTAVGDGARAEQFGDTAFGAGASATGDPSTAVGYQTLASGQHSTAIGGNAEATGDLSTALGQGSVASGANSLALGQGAQATHANAIAIGQGVQTNRDDQVAIGSASSTYTLAGISSSASRAAQSGPVYAVTADGAGNLATMDMQPWFGRIEGLEESVRQTDDRFRTQADGIAVALALGGAQVIQPGQTFALSANMGHFDGANAAGFGAIGRLEENVFVNLGVGHGFRTGTVAGRAGVSWGW